MGGPSYNVTTETPETGVRGVTVSTPLSQDEERDLPSFNSGGETEVLEVPSVETGVNELPVTVWNTVMSDIMNT